MAGGENACVKRSFVSSADLSAYANYIVELESDNRVGLADGASDILLGSIIDGGKASGDFVTVAIGGVIKVMLGGSVNEGDAITATSSGAAVATTTSGNMILGMAIEAGSSGEIISIDCSKAAMKYYAG